MTETYQEVRTEVVESLRLVQERNYGGAEKALQDGIDSGSAQGEELAVLYSTLGMIQKKQGKLQEAWNSYQLAERTVEDDPVLKVLTSRFLLNELGRYDDAIKRAKLILKTAKDVPSLRHQAYSIIGLAYLRKGQQRKAIEMLDKAMENHFMGMTSADNIDFNLVEALVREQIAVDKCQDYIRAACEFARSKREFKAMTVFQQILDSFEKTAV